ncbi:hypothetical protein C8R43DRAFT_398388 [Mycena crocata]|nr:hypothetical protein C8R43DRAFT_398388 [Mycena crocata]
MTHWLCPECPKGFSRKGDLTRHSLLHTGYRPHGCPECGKTFAQYSGLKTHLNVHTRDKPFRCGQGDCKAAFGDPSSCARHRKETHGRTGAYQCPDTRCGSSIKRRSAFTAHLRKHGMKFAGVDIDDFYSEVTQTSRATTTRSRIPLPEAKYVIEQVTDFEIDPVTTYDTPLTHYYTYPNGGMSAPSNDYMNDGNLHLATADLFAFSRSPSLSPPSLASSSSPSTSPSPSPLDFQNDAASYGLPNINFPETNASNDPGMSGVYAAELSPLSQIFQQLYKEPMNWA